MELAAAVLFRQESRRNGTSTAGSLTIAIMVINQGFLSAASESVASPFRIWTRGARCDRIVGYSVYALFCDDRSTDARGYGRGHGLHA